MIEILNRVITGDSLDVLKTMDVNKIDLTVTSPPYDNLRKYKGHSFDFEGIAKELFRVTKTGGVVVWIVSDATVNGGETGTSFRQALYFISLGFKLHDTMIYEKKNPIPLTHRRYEQKFEYMFVFVKGKLTTFNPLMRDNKHGGKVESGNFRHDGDVLTKRNTKNKNNKQSYRHNIWEYSVGRGSTTNDVYAFEHPAMFPEKLVEDHILSWSNEGDVILDCFGGAGTTAKMAKLNNRDFIHIEISAYYNDIAIQRVRL